MTWTEDDGVRCGRVGGDCAREAFEFWELGEEEILVE